MCRLHQNCPHHQQKGKEEVGEGGEGGGEDEGEEEEEGGDGAALLGSIASVCRAVTKSENLHFFNQLNVN